MRFALLLLIGAVRSRDASLLTQAAPIVIPLSSPTTGPKPTTAELIAQTMENPKVKKVVKQAKAAHALQLGEAARLKKVRLAIKAEVALELQTLKLTRQWIQARYDSFSRGQTTFQMLKVYFAKKLTLPPSDFDPGTPLGDMIDDEVGAVTARCDTGKRAMDECLYPTPTNVLWELSYETRVKEGGLDPNSEEARNLRQREANAAKIQKAIADGTLPGAKRKGFMFEPTWLGEVRTQFFSDFDSIMSGLFAYFHAIIL